MYQLPRLVCQPGIATLNGRDSHLRFARNSLSLGVALLLTVGICAEARAGSLSPPELSPNLYFEELPRGLASSVAEELPEGSNVDAAFTDPSFKPYLTLSEEANVFVSFVDEGAGYRNSLGYYTFGDLAFDGLTKSAVDTDQSGVVELGELAALDGVTMDWVFPNASKAGAGGLLSAGDTLTLNGGSTFSAGTNIGFFLTQNTWNGREITIDETGDETQVFYSNDFLNPEAPATASQGYQSVTSRSRHVAMLFADRLQTGIILAFEDLNRADRQENDNGYRSDEDFNDAVFYVTSNPVSALQNTDIPQAGMSVVPAPAALVLQASCVAVLIVPAWLRRRRKTIAAYKDIT